MNASIGLLIGAALLAGSASAQTLPPVAVARSSQASVAQSPTPAGRTVDSLTVTAPSAAKPCSSRDQTCIALVVAELKQRYPEELKRFCFQREMKAIQSNMLRDDLGSVQGGSDPRAPTSFGVNAALKTACARDKR